MCKSEVTGVVHTHLQKAVHIIELLGPDVFQISDLFGFGISARTEWVRDSSLNMRDSLMLCTFTHSPNINFFFAFL